MKTTRTTEQEMKRAVEEQITINEIADVSDSGVTVIGDCAEENIPIFAPYGYSYCPTAQTLALVARPTGAAAVLAVAMPEGVLGAGEVRIAAMGGYIHFKKGGAVEINGVTITAKGQIVPKGGAV